MWIFTLNWAQAWMAIPGGLVLAVVIMARQKLWNGFVEVMRILFAALIDWCMDPLRRFFWAVVGRFERHVMRALLYNPLSALGLVDHVSFETFCIVVYACVSGLFLWLLWHRIPSLWPIFFAQGRVRFVWVTIMLNIFMWACIGATGTLRRNGYAREAYMCGALSILAASAVVHAWFTYPSTGDGEDLVAILPNWWSNDDSFHSFVPTETRRSTRMKDMMAAAK